MCFSYWRQNNSMLFTSLHMPVILIIWINGYPKSNCIVHPTHMNPRLYFPAVNDIKMVATWTIEAEASILASDMIQLLNCNWVATRWQQYSTHLHTNSTQNDTKQTIHRTTQKYLDECGAVPHLCELMKVPLVLHYVTLITIPVLSGHSSVGNTIMEVVKLALDVQNYSSN